MKLIELYTEWMKTGKIFNDKLSRGDGGLCNAIPKKYKKTLDMFYPERPLTYWAHENYEYGMRVNEQVQYEFTPLRQAIVLLICAIHNEL